MIYKNWFECDGLVVCMGGSSVAAQRRAAGGGELHSSSLRRDVRPGSANAGPPIAFLCPTNDPPRCHSRVFCRPFPDSHSPTTILPSSPRSRAPFDSPFCFQTNGPAGSVPNVRVSHFDALLLFICTQTHAGPSWRDIIKSGGWVSLIDNCCAISSFVGRGRSHQR